MSNVVKITAVIMYKFHISTAEPYQGPLGMVLNSAWTHG